MIKDIEAEVTALKAKAPQVPETFMRRITSLETRYKTIEKTLKPAKRNIPKQWRAAKNIFAEHSSNNVSIQSHREQDVEAEDLPKKAKPDADA